jgi:hypothetical protein
MPFAGSRSIPALCLYFIMNAEQKARWSETRTGGRGSFVLTQGVLRVGLLFAVFSFLFSYFYRYGFTASKVSEYLQGGEPIFKFFFDCLFFGAIMGLFSWHDNEREFKQQEEKNKM